MSYREDWKEYLLNDLVKINYGKDHKKLDDGNIPVYGSGGIMRTVNKFIFNNESILIPRKGTLGNLFYVNEKFWTVDTLFWTQQIHKELNMKFLFFQLKTLNLASLNVGSAVPSLTTKVLNKLKIKLPPLQTQNRIASILSTFDEKIEVNRQMNATLEAMAQAMFREMCLPKDKEELEDGWEWRKIGSLYKTKSGGTPRRATPQYYENGEYLWVKSKELQESFVFDTEEKITEEALNNSSAKLIPPFSLLVAMYGATVGRFSILGEEASCNQAICAIMPNKGYKYSFIYSYLKEFRQELMNRAVGSAQQNISQIVIKQFEIICPPKPIVNEFQNNVEPLFLKILSNLKENQKLAEMRDSLLPQLMNGEIKV